jgi:hypothetical protein
LQAIGGVAGALKLMATGTVIFKYTSESKGSVRRHPRLFQIRGAEDRACLLWKVGFLQGLPTSKDRNVLLKDITRAKFGSEIHDEHPAQGKSERQRSITISFRTGAIYPEQTSIHLTCKTDEDFVVWKAGLRELLSPRPTLRPDPIVKFQAIVRGAQVRSHSRRQFPNTTQSPERSPEPSPMWLSAAPSAPPPLLHGRQHYRELVVTGWSRCPLHPTPTHSSAPSPANAARHGSPPSTRPGVPPPSASLRQVPSSAFAVYAHIQMNCIMRIQEHGITRTTRARPQWYRRATCRRSPRHPRRLRRGRVPTAPSPWSARPRPNPPAPAPDMRMHIRARTDLSELSVPSGYPGFQGFTDAPTPRPHLAHARMPANGWSSTRMTRRIVQATVHGCH